jgi:peptidyl-prolyl cis-trans isomerase A (cyclophilin A)
MRFIYLTVLLSFQFVPAKGQIFPEVIIHTTMGKVLIEVDTLHAPVSGKNFLFHCRQGTYQKGIFYRTVKQGNQPDNQIKIEVVQAGLFHSEEIEKYPVIIHENTNVTGLKHLDGTVSMARAEPGTASTEFFICIGDQPELDYGGKRNPDGQGFAAFGRVVEGMDVVKRIQQLPNENQYLTVPLEFNVEIKKE